MKKKGFTLVEILVVSVIFMILMQAIYSFFIRNIKIANDEKNKAYIDNQAKTIMDNIGQCLKNSWQETIDTVDKKDTSKGIELEIPRDKNSSVYEGSNSDLYRFEMDSKNKAVKVTKKEGKSENIEYVLSGYVDDFTITKDESYIIIKLKVDYKIRDLNREFKLHYNIRKD